MGGAKNCPETPRQKMIGMMYLVLTAMLALNVASDILNGFKLVDKSLHASLDATAKRNATMMDNFRAQRDLNPEKNGEWYNVALELGQKSDSLYNYIQNFKFQIAALADGAKVDSTVRTIGAMDNLDKSGQYALVQRDPLYGKPNGEVLQDKINEYKDYLIALSDGKKREEFEQLFAMEKDVNGHGELVDWQTAVFDMMPVGATITILTKLQNDVRSAQGEMIQYIMGQTDASDFRVNKIEVFVVPNSNYVIRGGKYSAHIVLAAVDSTQKPEYYVEGMKINDQGIYEVVASGTGLKKYSGELVLPSNDGGEPVHIPFSSSYSVGEPAVTIANTDLNIMYSEYENRFSVSVPGVSNDKVKVSVQGASAQLKGGYWIINPSTSAKTVKINVQAEIDGKLQAMGSQEYRVKVKPAPGVYFRYGTSEIKEGKIARSALLNPSSTVVASYGPDGLLDLKYTVTSFQLYINGQLYPVNGSKFSKQQLDVLSKLKPGAAVNIVDVRAKDANGVPYPKSLGGMMLILN